MEPSKSKPGYRPGTTLKLRLDKFVWLMIYGGMVAMGLGLALRNQDAAVGWGVCSVGACMTVVGICLIGMRTRITREP